MSDETRARWRRADELLEDVLDLAPEAAEAEIARRAASDPGLAREVRSLLAAHRAAGDSFLAAPPVLAAGLLPEADSQGDAGPAEGARVGPFRLVGELGRGGMGTVFLAERVEGGFEQRVAVKLLGLAAFSEEAQRRFRLERQILARLDHPGIARLVDGGVLESGRTWFALEAVDGVAIDLYCRRRALGVRGRLELFLGVLDAVEYAHRSLIVHRDLKPSNVLVTAAGEVKLLDFGIAKVLEPEESADSVQAPTLLRALTLQYAAPEQLRGEAVTTATDVYSLGVLLFELLTGRLPYRDGDAIARAILEEEALAPSLAVDEVTRERTGMVAGLRPLRRQLAGDLDAILLKALRKESAARYATVAALALDLRRHLDGRPVEARGEARAYRVGRFLRRHRTAVVAAVLVLVTLAGGLLAALAEARRAQREARKAEKVQEFLLRILSASDPAQAKGAAVTVREVLDAGAKEIDTQLGGEPEVRDRVLEMIGSVYLQLGEYDAALPLAERRVALRRDLYGASSSEVAEAQLLAANILFDRGRVDEAEERYKAARAILEASRDPESPAAREAMSGVAACLRSRNDLAGAEALQRQLVELARRHEGPDSEAALGAENSLAMTLGGAERYAESAAVFRHIVALDAAAGRGATPDALTHRYNLAVDLVRSGDWSGARQVFIALLPEARRVLGADHPRLALAERWYAWLLDEAGSPGAAASALADCRRIQTAAFGADDAQLGWTRAIGARIAAHAGDAPAAESEARAALAMLEKTLGADNPATGFGWEALAQALLAAGRPAEARAAADRAVALRRGFKLRGRTLAAALDLAAEAARRAGDSAAAIALGEEALAIWNARATADPPEAARARVRLAAARLDRGERQAAGGLLAAARADLLAGFVPGAPELTLAAEVAERLAAPPASGN